jgi:hypothetical protein
MKLVHHIEHATIQIERGDGDYVRAQAGVV